MNWFFVVGCPRSGTTMLQQALNRHPGVVIPPETAFLTCLLQSHRGQLTHLGQVEQDLGIRLDMPARRVKTESTGRVLFEQIAGKYLARIRRDGVTHFGEKSPEHLRRYSAIRRVFSDARVVLMHRDGRDVALSLSKVPWMPGDLYLGFALWLHYERVAIRAARMFGADLHTVRYENLVRAGAGTPSRVQIPGPRLQARDGLRVGKHGGNSIVGE